MRERNLDYIWFSLYVFYFDKVGIYVKWWGVLYYKLRLVYILILWLDKIYNILFYLGDFWFIWCIIVNLEFVYVIFYYKMMIL